MSIERLEIMHQCQWIATNRWRVTMDINGRTVTFTMYSMEQPTEEQAVQHYLKNSGEAIDITPIANDPA